jgi:lysophospholipase L1-like esterase
MRLSAQASQFILFGDSLTEWAFDEHNEGFGWHFQQKYGEKVQVQCEGTKQLAANACTTRCTGALTNTARSSRVGTIRKKQYRLEEIDRRL